MDFHDEFAAKYGLRKEQDYWWHKPSGKWIISHDAVIRIAQQAGIRLTFRDDPIDTSPDHKCICVRAWVKGKEDEWIEMLGECHVGSGGPISREYPWAMAQKRAEDRAVLRIVAPGGGIYSDIEADDFQHQPAGGAAEPAPQGGTSIEDLCVPDHLLEGLPGSEDKLKFGKHKGKTWNHMNNDSEDSEYLDWLIDAAYEDKGDDVSKWSKNAQMALALRRNQVKDAIPF